MAEDTRAGFAALIGAPNAGKSSVIRSLTNSRRGADHGAKDSAATVSATPGFTKALREVRLDAKLTLIDSPGVVGVTSSGDTRSAQLASLLVRGCVDPAELGDDAVDAGGGNDRLDGGNGNDTLLGGDGDDVISGGNGDDVVSGGGGNDRLSGGNGGDRFVFGADGSIDTLLDFRSGQDKIDLSGLGIDAGDVKWQGGKLFADIDSDGAFDDFTLIVQGDAVKTADILFA